MKAIKDVRLDFNYSSNGLYFVTIVTNRRIRHFAGDKRDVVARFIGRLSEEKGLYIEKSAVTDDHVHMILRLDGCEMSLGEAVRRLKARTSQALGLRVWQPNYYEHIIRSERALKAIWQYVENNPLAEKLDLDSIYSRRPINRATTGEPQHRPMNRAATTNG